jgi:hypothetical protein
MFMSLNITSYAAATAAKDAGLTDRLDAPGRKMKLLINKI